MGNILNTNERFSPHFEKHFREKKIRKYDAHCSISNELRGVWKCDQTLSLLFDKNS